MAVYFIEDKHRGAIKIGYVANPVGRLKALQTGNASPLRLLGYVSGCLADEARLHRRFRHLEIMGEWFRDTPELRDCIDVTLGAGFVSSDALAERPRMPKPALRTIREEVSLLVSKGEPRPYSSFWERYQEVREAVCRALFVRLGWPSDIYWWDEDALSLYKKKTNNYQYQIMPEIGFDCGDKESAAFWWWHVDANQQWFPSYITAADAYVDAWMRWKRDER